MEVDNSLSEQIAAAFGDKTLYEVLSVERTASNEDIRRGYRRMALKLHPDKGGTMYIVGLFVYSCSAL